MPGTWPSWADDPNPIPPPFTPGPETQLDSPANLPDPGKNGFFTLFGGFSAAILGAWRAVRWRVAEPIQPTEPTEPTELTESTQSHSTTATSTSTVIQTARDGGFRATKRPRLDSGSGYEQALQPPRPNRPRFERRLNCQQGFLPTPGRSQPYRQSGFIGPYPAYLRHRGPIPSSSSNNTRPVAYRATKRNEIDSNFNHAGHFSVDAIDTSDSEDDDYPGSPMDIDSPKPIVLNQMETILARQPIEPIPPQSNPQSDEHTPIALNKTEAILAQEPIDSINVESPSKLNSVAAAAQRATKMFPKGYPKSSPISRVRGTPVIKRNVPLQTPSTEHPSPATPDNQNEGLRYKGKAASASPDTPTPQKAEKARYENVLEFFPNDVIHSLPGLEDESLPADVDKVEHLKREYRERVRLEEIASQNAMFAHLGVRRPKSTLIQKPSPTWVNRALDAPAKGTFNPRTVHPDAVELKPRDFAKLVPPTAWLNDDCVHSSLCCLAASINNKAGARYKIDPPKCVAVSSLYWNAFCGDYSKLFPRLFSRKWGMTPDNFLEADTVLIPVNSNAHWTLIVIRPSRRTVSYIDSFHSRGETQTRHAYQWLKLFLGNKFVDDDWETQDFSTPRQTNAWDCGMFVITNAMCLALGISPMSYDEDMMPIQRQRIAAMLLNGGFHGEFDLGHL